MPYNLGKEKCLLTYSLIDEKNYRKNIKKDKSISGCIAL